MPRRDAAVPAFIHFSSKTSARIHPPWPSLRRRRDNKSKAVDFLSHGGRILVNLAPYSWDERKEGWKMTRIKIFLACAVFIFCFNPPIALSQLYYPPYYQLWLQSVENQAQIQDLQRQLADMRAEIGALQRDLTSIFESEKRLEELEIANQNTIKTLLDELAKMQKEIGEIHKTLSPQNE